jgi:UDP-N-acetylglucosamine 2-epimerase (non-hydrolysing)
LKTREYAVLTLHRVSNVDDAARLKELFGAIRQISRRLPVIFPVHPRTAKRLEEFGLSDVLDPSAGIFSVEPLGYLDFLSLLCQSRLVLTDSGSLQAETTLLGVPCLTLRDNTEWGVTIHQGTNHLAGTNGEKIVQQAQSILSEEIRERGPLPELWDGNTSKRISEQLLQAG